MHIHTCMWAQRGMYVYVCVCMYAYMYKVYNFLTISISPYRCIVFFRTSSVFGHLGPQKEGNSNFCSFAMRASCLRASSLN